jgi:hypothetical protein
VVGVVTGTVVATGVVVATGATVVVAAGGDVVVGVVVVEVGTVGVVVVVVGAVVVVVPIPSGNSRLPAGGGVRTAPVKRSRTGKSPARSGSDAMAAFM